MSSYLSILFINHWFAGRFLNTSHLTPYMKVLVDKTMPGSAFSGHFPFLIGEVSKLKHNCGHSDHPLLFLRGYCSRRLRRLRKTLNFKMGNRHKFTGKKVTEEILSDNRYGRWMESCVSEWLPSFWSFIFMWVSWKRVLCTICGYTAMKTFVLLILMKMNVQAVVQGRGTAHVLLSSCE